MINIPKILTQGEGLTVEFKLAKNELPSSFWGTIRTKHGIKKRY